MGTSLQSKFPIFFFLSFLILLTAEGRVDKKPFRIQIEGHPEAAASLRKRAELKMAKSTSFCRGFYMPKLVSKWKCKGTGPRITTCQAQYSCKPTTTKFNRSSETKRIRRELRKMKVSKANLKVKVSRRPYKKLSKSTRKLVRKLQKVRPAPKPRPTPVPKISPPRSVVTKSIMQDELDELDDFNESDKVDEALVKSELDQDLSEGLDDDLDEDLEELNESVEKKTKKLNEKQASNDEDDKDDESEENDDSPYSSKAAKLAAFSFELVQVADDFDSIVTFGASWTPRKSFNSKIGMRGQFGFKSLKIFSGTALEETFLVYDLGLFLSMNFNKNLYAEVGYVLEKWNNSAGDSHSALTVGAGYIFTNKLLKVIDRIFIDYATVSNETSNRELKFAAGFSF